MPTTPEGPISVPLAAVEDLLAASTAFQGWVGAANATAAKSRIHVIGLPSPAANRPSYTADELNAMRPFAVLNYDVAEPMTMESVAQGQFIPNGRILISLEANVAGGDARDFKEAAYKFLNVVGQVVEQVAAASESGGSPVVQRVRMRMSPRRAEEKERPARGDFLVTIVGLEFGLGS